MSNNNKLKIMFIGLVATVLLIPSIAKADYWNPLVSFGQGIDAIGNFFQGMTVFIYNIGFVVSSTIFFVMFFAIEIGLIYIYWRIGSYVYNTLVPVIKKLAVILEGMA